jgi:hypothetical protein
MFLKKNALLNGLKFSLLKLANSPILLLIFKRVFDLSSRLFLELVFELIFVDFIELIFVDFCFFSLVATEDLFSRLGHFLVSSRACSIAEFIPQWQELFGPPFSAF